MSGDRFEVTHRKHGFFYTNLTKNIYVQTLAEMI